MKKICKRNGCNNEVPVGQNYCSINCYNGWENQELNEFVYKGNEREYQREYQIQYREKNRESFNKYHQEYYYKNGGKHKEAMRKRYYIKRIAELKSKGELNSKDHRSLVKCVAKLKEINNKKR